MSASNTAWNEDDEWRHERQRRYKLRKGDIVQIECDEIVYEGEVVFVYKDKLFDHDGEFERDDESLIEIWDYQKSFKGIVPVSRCTLIKKYKRPYRRKEVWLCEQLELFT